MNELVRKAPPAVNDGEYLLNNRIFFRLFQLGNVLQRQSVSELGVTTVQWAVLGALSQERYRDGYQLRDLGEYLVVSRQNLDGVIKRLERDKLVERITDVSNKRNRLVRLTPKGRVFWQNLADQINEFYNQAAGHLRFDDRVGLVHQLNRLQERLQTVELTSRKK